MKVEKPFRVGLLGGTFDPIHCGHLNLAFELMEKGPLDQVWFIPAQLSPFKCHAPPLSVDHRIMMVRLAIRDIPQFYVKEVEKESPVPSYTICTLRTLLAQEASAPSSRTFYLMMGEDAVAEFSRWHLPEEIVQLVPLLIGSRSGLWQPPSEGLNASVRGAIQAGLISTRLMDVSSTDIRLRLAKHDYCGHLVAAEVLQYIRDHRLYTHPR